MKRIVALALSLLLSAAGIAQAADKLAGRVPVPAYTTPASKADAGEACVAPTEEMRRDHMKMLFHQRDRTVREGIRETRFSLKNCVECHASKDTGSVLGTQGFCSSCHAYTAVKIDCFECHSSMRQAKTAGARK